MRKEQGILVGEAPGGEPELGLRATKKILALLFIWMKEKPRGGHTGQAEPSRSGSWVLCGCRGNKCTFFFMLSPAPSAFSLLDIIKFPVRNEPFRKQIFEIHVRARHCTRRRIIQSDPTSPNPQGKKKKLLQAVKHCLWLFYPVFHFRHTRFNVLSGTTADLLHHIIVTFNWPLRDKTGKKWWR